MAAFIANRIRLVGMIRSPLRSTVPDRSNGYEAVAEEFARARTPTIGPRVVREWAQGLPPGASILNIGCGHGIPISNHLNKSGDWHDSARRDLGRVFWLFPGSALPARAAEEIPEVVKKVHPQFLG